ncbi:hypothetical protein ACOSZF_11505 [Cytobacillus firmus]|nr:hypothetical protein [Cytobacillus firmus]MDD9311978.1 hypothetical protein [Cytobacillus firmus]MED1905356.1 hypothetical protein [Cytobacillus firmus]MED1940156.1 hypothetical protein [Cytobacillus firmus]
MLAKYLNEVKDLLALLEKEESQKIKRQISYISVNKKPLWPET